MSDHKDEELRDLLEHYLFRKKCYDSYCEKSEKKYQDIMYRCEGEILHDKRCFEIMLTEDEYYLPAKDYSHSSTVKCNRLKQMMFDTKREFLEAIEA